MQDSLRHVFLHVVDGINVIVRLHAISNLVVKTSYMIHQRMYIVVLALYIVTVCQHV